jgi:hypothetical protein
MDIDKEINELKEEEKQEQIVQVWSCWPSTSSAGRFWGVLLVVIGGIWLLGNFGLAMTLLWPLFFIGLGLFYLSRARENHYL